MRVLKWVVAYTPSAVIAVSLGYTWHNWQYWAITGASWWAGIIGWVWET